ncbi:MAG: hypothetical protein IT456_05115 [Planctomycetes bacterium]|nr:hypothetical protein [Planctomycetota bacterium]
MGERLPPPPTGVYYVEVEGANSNSAVVARRSDGQAVGRDPYGLIDTPPLDPGTSYVEVSAASGAGFVGRVGPTSTYVAVGGGCAGTLPAARLVPRDTPRIGKVHEVTVFDLPQHCAFMLFGWSQTAPLSLSGYGMPGCAAHVSPDTAVFVAGQQGHARFRLPIPDYVGLVGLHFYNQALVLDSAANALGAVMSEASEGAIGHW